MISHFTFTVPLDKENINNQIKRFVISQKTYFEVNETEHGFDYSIEFDSDYKKQIFNKELSERFPNLYR